MNAREQAIEVMARGAYSAEWDDLDLTEQDYDRAVMAKALDALLAATQEQTCPNPNCDDGRVYYGGTDELHWDAKPCPDCSDGVMPGTEPLVLLGPELVAYHDDQRSPYWFNEAYIKENASVFARAYPVYRRAGSPDA